MRVSTRETLRVCALWLFLVGLLCLVMSLVSCRSAPPCVCPELDLPEVVEVLVTEPQLLPVPSSPDYQFCFDLACVYDNLDEAANAFEYCASIIQVNNAEVE